ncbi:MAG: hypothetical protein ACYCXW_21585 [Solirubrobacteraceae bacterium]
MDDRQEDYNLVALRRAARTLSTDARDVSNVLADVVARLESGQASMEASGSLDAAVTLAGAYWSLVHVANTLPWLRTEVHLLAAALPAALGGRAARLAREHPWQRLDSPSPLRLDEDLFDAQFDL